MTPLDPSYRLIPLTQGQFALVSPQHYDWLNQWKWFALWRPKSNTFYAVRNSPRGLGPRHLIQMHRLILGLERGDKREGDHRNRNGLDNRIGNLRLANHSQQKFNQGLRSDNASGYRGISKKKGRTHWRVEICENGNRHVIGYFRDLGDAIRARKEASEKYHGEFAGVS